MPMLPYSSSMQSAQSVDPMAGLPWKQLWHLLGGGLGGGLGLFAGVVVVVWLPVYGV